MDSIVGICALSVDGYHDSWASDSSFKLYSDIGIRYHSSGQLDGVPWSNLNELTSKSVIHCTQLFKPSNMSFLHYIQSYESISILTASPVSWPKGLNSAKSATRLTPLFSGTVPTSMYPYRWHRVPGGSFLVTNNPSYFFLPLFVDSLALPYNLICSFSLNPFIAEVGTWKAWQLLLGSQKLWHDCAFSEFAWLKFSALIYAVCQSLLVTF